MGYKHCAAFLVFLNVVEPEREYNYIMIVYSWNLRIAAEAVKVLFLSVPHLILICKHLTEAEVLALL